MAVKKGQRKATPTTSKKSKKDCKSKEKTTVSSCKTPGKERPLKNSRDFRAQIEVINERLLNGEIDVQAAKVLIQGLNTMVKQINSEVIYCKHMGKKTVIDFYSCHNEKEKL